MWLGYSYYRCFIFFDVLVFSVWRFAVELMVFMYAGDLRGESMGRTLDVQKEKSQEPEVFNIVTELLKQAGGCVATDGGFATQLERHGADINDPLWSALCLITMPDLIRTVINRLFTEIVRVF